jgi:hypothetical protein
MLVRLRTLAFLTLALAGWSQIDGGILLLRRAPRAIKRTTIPPRRRARIKIWKLVDIT